MQHTLAWHVNDLKSSHVDSAVNNEFLEWLQKKYTNDNIGKVKATKGVKHNYLAMVLDYSKQRVLKVDMTSYMKSMIANFPPHICNEGNVLV
jgi:hypothetical protein